MNMRIASWVTGQLKAEETEKFQVNSRNALNWWKSTQPATLKTNFDSYATKLRKMSCKTFNKKTYVT